MIHLNNYNYTKRLTTVASVLMALLFRV